MSARSTRHRSGDRHRRGFSSRAVAAAVLVGLLIGASATYIIFGRTITATTTLPAVTRTTTITTSQTIQVAAAVASNGLRLTTSINATELTLGKKPSISVSVFNTLPHANGFFPQRSFDWPKEPGNWTFYGVPVTAWPECTKQFFFSWPMPISVVVLRGDYSVQQLTSVANIPVSIHACGPTSPTFPEYTFNPNSDLINITAQFDGGVGVRPLGQFRLAANFTVDGSWNMADLAQTATSYCEPAVANVCDTPQTTPFVPGVCTIGVVDEWGQYTILHFVVSG